MIQLCSRKRARAGIDEHRKQRSQYSNRDPITPAYKTHFKKFFYVWRQTQVFSENFACPCSLTIRFFSELPLDKQAENSFRKNTKKTVRCHKAPVLFHIQRFSDLGLPRLSNHQHVAEQIVLSLGTSSYQVSTSHYPILVLALRLVGMPE